MQVDGYSLDAQRDKLRKYAAYEMRESDWSSDVCSSDLGCVKFAMYTLRIRCGYTIMITQRVIFAFMEKRRMDCKNKIIK